MKWERNVVADIPRETIVRRFSDHIEYYAVFDRFYSDGTVERINTEELLNEKKENKDERM